MWFLENQVFSVGDPILSTKATSTVEWSLKIESLIFKTGTPWRGRAGHKKLC